MNHNMVAEVNYENTSNTDNTGYIFTLLQWNFHSFKGYYLPGVIVSNEEIHHRSFDETNYGYKGHRLEGKGATYVNR